MEDEEFVTNLDDRPVAYYADYQLFSSITGTPGEEDLTGFM